MRHVRSIAAAAAILARIAGSYAIGVARGGGGGGGASAASTSATGLSSTYERSLARVR